MRNLLVLVVLFCACGQGKEPDLAGEWVVSFETGAFEGISVIAGIYRGALTLDGENHDLAGDLVLGCRPVPCAWNGAFGMTAFGWDGWSGLFTVHIPTSTSGAIMIDGDFGSDALAGDIHAVGGGGGAFYRLGSMYAYRVE